MKGGGLGGERESRPPALKGDVLTVGAEGESGQSSPAVRSGSRGEEKVG